MVNALIRHAFGATPSPEIGGRLCRILLLDGANKRTTIVDIYADLKEKSPKPSPDLGGL